MITIKIKETKRFDYNALAKDMFNQMQQHIKQTVSDKLKDVRCPEHDTIPEIHIEFGADDKAVFTIPNSCCPAFTQQVWKKIDS